MSSLALKKSQFERILLEISLPALSIGLDFYGLRPRLFSDDAGFISELRNYHPSEWLSSTVSDIEFRFHSYARFFDETFFDEESADFNVFQRAHLQCCIQRDFVGWTSDHRVFNFVTNLKIDDGYFNCLRWALPTLLINSQGMVVHSSCFVADNGFAYLFLGPSGAGKTTTVLNLREKLVLGDDMNVISLTTRGPRVHSGAIGGQVVHPKFDESYPLKGIFWLEKDRSLNVTPMSVADARLKMLGSLANLFFGVENAGFLDVVLERIEALVQTVPSYTLELKKGDDAWSALKQI